MNKYLGIALVVLAIGMTVVPKFTDCQSQGKAITLANGMTVPMKCHWTGVGEFALAVPLGAVGAFSIFNRRRENLRMLGVIGVILGTFAILLPNGLIGVCSSAMLCNTTMQPALTVGGSMVVLGSVGVFFSKRKPDDLPK
jgi:hypothetical protein